MIFLKKIYAEGFKSFALPTTIEFDKNMVSIVGPNGSGKSNIVDAIKWTIGEQSIKNLRGIEKDNLIFAGSEILPEADSAYVELTFDNSNKFLDTTETEIKIARKLEKQSQESTFYVNGKVAKLKDINNLFLDTGLTKGSLGIISQGTVSWFAEAKPVERRKIFEEASNIGKYSKKKNDSLSLLEKTENNLMSISKYLDGLKKEVEKLTIQAEKLKLYEQKTNEFKNIDLIVKAKELLLFQTNFDSIKNVLNELEQKDKDLRLQNTISQELNKKWNDEYKEIEQKFDSLTSQKEQLMNKLYDLKQKQNLFDLKLKNDLNSADAQKKANAYKITIDSQKKELLFLQNQNAIVDEEIIKISDELKLNNQKYFQNSSLINKYQQDLAEINFNIRSIKEQQERSIDKNVNQIIENKNIFNGVVDVLQNLITVDKQNELAIATALGSSIKNIVTLDEISAKKAIDFLKKNQLGIITFLPINKIKPKIISEDFLSLVNKKPGFISVASELVQIDKKYKIVLDHLLGNIIIVDNLENANVIADTLDQRFKIITMEGDVKNPGGSITGGYRKTNVNKTINWKEKLDLLNQQLSDKQVQINLIMNENTKIENIKNDLNTKIVDKKSILNENNKKIFELESSISTISAEYETLTNKKIDNDSETINIDDVNIELLQTQKDYNAIEQEIQFLSTSKKDAFEQMEAEKSKFINLKDNLIKISDEINEYNQKLKDIVTQKEKIIQSVIENYSLSQENLLSEYGDKTLDYSIEDAKQRINQLKFEIDQLGLINQEAILELETKSQELQVQQKEFDDVQYAVNQIKESIVELDTKAKNDFVETIDKVNSYIPSIFNKFFGGGECKVKILDKENVLESGIEIIAQPLGKKIKNLTLLSGGEKTLVALTILFAILKASKFPLIILDEAEAALDEYNVETFSKIIKEFSAINQFLIITHRVGTMKISDELYGITMQDKGVSLVIRTSFDKINFQE